MKNKIYIDINLLTRIFTDEKGNELARCDKDTLSAVAFCIMVKDRFISSSVSNATMRRLNELFHIGHRRMKRIIEKGREMGLISIDMFNTLVVHQVHTNGRKYRKDYKEAKKSINCSVM